MQDLSTILKSLNEDKVCTLICRPDASCNFGSKKYMKKSYENENREKTCVQFFSQILTDPYNTRLKGQDKRHGLKENK